MATPFAICEPDQTLRRRMGAAAAAAGFTVDFPRHAAQWAASRNGVVLLTVLTRDQLIEVQNVKEACPGGTIVVLLNPLEPTAVRAALRRGAGTVLGRWADPRDVLSAVRLARSGNVVLPTQLLYELTAAAGDLAPSLDDDELELLRYLAEGATVQRIARVRHQATRTVERHLCRLYSRLGAQDRMQAVGTAIQMGLIRMPVRQA